jgi:hypothetical protein
MRYNININNKKAVEWGLNIQQAYLFVFFYELPSWANSITYEGETYFFASKNKALEEMPLLTNKRDTMYRYYKQIEDKGLIKSVKFEGKDYVCLTEKGKQWNWESEPSEKNPNKVGKKSESPSEKNPTYNNTINNNNTSNNNIPAFEDFIKYALNEKPKANREQLKLKYKAWKENNWKDGNGKKIKNWKTKLLNTLPYIDEEKQQKQHKFL